MATFDRREFLRYSALAGTALMGVEGLLARSIQPAWGAPPPGGGYGPLFPTPSANTGETIISLPEGFRYNVFGKNGDLMSDGTPTPGTHDGMASFRWGGSIRLVRNHELRGAPFVPNGQPVIADPAEKYDPSATAGTTTLVINPRTRLPEADFVSIAGTHTNCAGGLTPWGSWLTCEEVVAGPRQGWLRKHGYNFDVPAGANGPVNPIPLKAMGRFVHEAIAIDPKTGIVYQTEDANPSGFYRFIPDRPGSLASGRLQILRIRHQSNYDTRTGQTLGKQLLCTWADINDPDPDLENGATSVYRQGEAKGAAKFARLEGCWYGNGSVFIVSTSGGDAGKGQVWEFRPSGSSPVGHLSLVFESPGAAVLDAPDNICVSPWGTLFLCEDGGGGDQYVRVVYDSGRIFDFAKNLISDDEFAGATFDAESRTLFMNIQGGAAPGTGMTMAIWGPWEQ